MESPSPQCTAKPYKGIAFVLLTVVVILMTGCLLFLWASGSLRPPMSEAQARKLVQEAGGADKICREASLLLNVGKYKNPYEFHSLSIYDNPLEITNYPALSVLVTNSHTRSLVLEHGHDGLPPHIQIMYGPHMHIKFMSIFGETNGLDQHFVDSHVQLSSNIFFSK